MNLKGVIALFLLLFLLTGCNDKIKKGNLDKDLAELRGIGVITCKDKGMDYVAMETLQYENYQSICMTISPPKIYRFKIEK